MQGYLVGGAVRDRLLGRPVEELFRSSESRPLASASISQVHAAVTTSGRRVAVKVQRPNATEIVATDISLLKDLARLAARHIPSSRIYKPEEIIEQFDQTLSTELDFYHEGRTMDLFRDLFRSNRGIYIPEVMWEMTTARVLTMEFLEGTTVAQVLRQKRLSVADVVHAAAQIAEALQAAYGQGFAQRDVKPSNMMLRTRGNA